MVVRFKREFIKSSYTFRFFRLRIKIFIEAFFRPLYPSRSTDFNQTGEKSGAKLGQDFGFGL